MPFYSVVVIEGDRQDLMDVGVPYTTSFQPRAVAAADARVAEAHPYFTWTGKSAPAAWNRDGILGTCREKNHGLWARGGACARAAFMEAMDEEVVFVMDSAEDICT